MFFSKSFNKNFHFIFSVIIRINIHIHIRIRIRILIIMDIIGLKLLLRAPQVSQQQLRQVKLQLPKLQVQQQPVLIK